MYDQQQTAVLFCVNSFIRCWEKTWQSRVTVLTNHLHTSFAVWSLAPYMFYWFSPALHITALLSLSILFMSGYFRSPQYTSETSTFLLVLRLVIFMISTLLLLLNLWCRTNERNMLICLYFECLIINRVNEQTWTSSEVINCDSACLAPTKSNKLPRQSFY